MHGRTRNAALAVATAWLYGCEGVAEDAELDTAAVLAATVPTVAAESKGVANLITAAGKDRNRSLVDEELMPAAALFTQERATTVIAGRHAADGVRVRLAGFAMNIELPGAGDAAPADAVAGGMVRYRRVAPQSEIVVQATAEGAARIMAVLTGPQAPETFRFPMRLPEEARLVVDDAGGVAVLNADGDAVAAVAPPWGRDATGAEVPTRYTIDGHTLSLHVDHRNATYPVVADPTWVLDCSWGSCSIYYSRSTTSTMQWTNGAIAALAMTFGPHWAIKLGGVALGVITAKAASCASKNQCLRVRRFHIGGIPAFYCDGGRFCHN